MADQPKLTPVKSSMMNGYAYNPDTRDLTVEFSGGARYSYADVPAEKVEAMRGNKSVGGYFSAKIRDHHKATKL